MIEAISGKQFPEKVIPLLDNSVKSIDIVVFDWRWYPNDPAASAQLFNQAFFYKLMPLVEHTSFDYVKQISDILLFSSIIIIFVLVLILFK
jgi:hypothetical protein